MSVIAQLQQLGAPPEVLRATAQRMQQQAEVAHIAVWPENWHAVLAWVAMATQWHWLPVAPEPVRTGLRLEALPAVLPAVRAQVPPDLRRPYAELLGQLQAMEDAALTEWRLQRR